MTFPEPFRARPARPDDLDELVALIHACDLAEVGFADPARDDLIEDWASTCFDFERDTVVAGAPDGSIAAYGSVLALDPTLQLMAFGRVHPDQAGRGLGSALLAEYERRARARLPWGVPAPLRTGVAETNRAAKALMTSYRFELVRSFWHMSLVLRAGELAEAEAPAGVTIRPATAGDDEAVAHRILEEAFGDHFGFEPMGLDDWLGEMRAASAYDPALALLAFEGEEAVGASVNLRADDGIGWVGQLGVCPAWRARGIGMALLVRSFAALAATGHHEARLSVDAENASGAIHLYERVGMKVRRRFDVYEKSLTGA